MTDPRKPGALAGIRIVSMAEQYPGPFCTLTLSDMGADVIQVERPGGDPARFLPSFYEALNRNKRAVALDARIPEQKAELLDLIAKADVFIEGFRPGKLAKLGLGYDDLKALNPRLVYASVSGYGQTGPYRMRPAHDLGFQGHAGALDERISGAVTGLPPAVLLGDTMSALYAAVGILSALVARDRTGQGTHIDIAMSEAVAALQTSFVAADAAEEATLPQRDPGYDLYETADGRWLTTSIAHENAYWDQLCRDVGVAEGIGLNRTDRVARREELVGKIAARIRQQPFAHWHALFEASGQMWAPALRRSELAADPQFHARGLFAETTRADGTPQQVMRQPIKFSAYDNAPLRPAPKLGQHTGETFD
ncbi:MULTISPECIES: CaiB/BaiF CoA transferase family protein [unclassified Marinovum]